MKQVRLNKISKRVSGGRGRGDKLCADVANAVLVARVSLQIAIEIWVLGRGNTQ